ncbi:MAG: hypothetical protein Ct9H90mP9_3560 [Pseudomonadota bacterium]|nr:MAG: hypothetical protein Ct9H90mP9_3560 [Pseudomonadota bacterium]
MDEGSEILHHRGCGGNSWSRQFLGLQSILSLILSHGARLARPGEFTERAFLGGRLDLTRVEAVSDPIQANSNLALKQAHNNSGAGFTIRLRNSAIDWWILHRFWKQSSNFLKKVLILATEMNVLQNWNGSIWKWSECSKVRPRDVGSGKASVSQSLADRTSGNLHCSISCSRKPGPDCYHCSWNPPGDTIEESLQIEGLAYRLTDTAGIRESDDPVESEGIERSRKVWQEADLTLLLLDASNALNEEDQTLLKKV